MECSLGYRSAFKRYLWYPEHTRIGDSRVWSYHFYLSRRRVGSYRIFKLQLYLDTFQCQRNVVLPFFFMPIYCWRINSARTATLNYLPIWRVDPITGVVSVPPLWLSYHGYSQVTILLLFSIQNDWVASVYDTCFFNYGNPIVYTYLKTWSRKGLVT